MPKKLNNFPFPSLKRIRQLKESYCGPAVLEMLFSFWEVPFNQDEIVLAAGIEEKIKDHGMLINEMAIAVGKLTPEFRFWFKRKTEINELEKVVEELGFPAGVEFQECFSGVKADCGFEDEDDDAGHYSVVTKINIKKNEIYIADPYIGSSNKDRKFSLLSFERRWWDINEVANKKTGRKKEVDDYHVMFMILPKEINFPKELGMKSLN